MYDIRNTIYDIRYTKYEPGFTIAEVLIVLAIMGILLTAIAVAFNASIINYRQNEQMFKTINNARQALCRITTQLRTADWVDLNNDPNYECSFRTADDSYITYQYSKAENKLYLITNSNGHKYVLCENVASMSFKTRTDDGSVCKSVQISMTVQSPDQVVLQRTLSAAVVIRRNLN